VPPNVREAVAGWANTAWWVDGDGAGPYLAAEPRLFAALRALDGVEETFRVEEPRLLPTVERAAAARWLEEHGVRVVPEDRDPPGEYGRSPRDVYGRVLEAWQRRLDHSGQGTPHGSYWDDVVPVQPLPEQGSV
jgi:hypothetical protein